MSDFYYARQPIFDRSLSVVGYELLHRSGPQNAFVPIDADVASSTTIDRAAMSVGLEQITEGRFAFVNVSRKVLLDEIYTLLPPGRTIIELLETVAPDADVIRACERLKQNGYQLALDDFAGDPSFRPLVELADVVKIDLQLENAPRALAMAAPLQKRGVRLLAEKVETPQMHHDAIGTGYDLFQGYFFCRPQMLEGKDLSPTKLHLLRFLSEVCRDDASFERLEEIFKAEVSLATRLLRYLNSAGFGWNHEITSLHHALRLVGMRQLQKWGAMLGVVSLTADRPQELAATALIRARFSEQLGGLLGAAGRELELFLMGLLSLIDAMMGKPLREVLAGMTISEEIREALLDGRTPLGDVLRVVTAYENGDWGQVEDLLAARGADARRVQEAYAGSLLWARQALEA